MKRFYFLFVSIALLTGALEAQKSAVFAPNGIAIRGYDPVAFFRSSKAINGADSISYSWEGAEWHFNTNENRELFKANPLKYAPQFGGYCAYGTAEGHKAPTEVDTWTVLADKLYFNYNRKVQQHWNQDRPALIRKAEDQWPLIKDKP